MADRTDNIRGNRATRPPQPQVRALCCDCAAVRLTSLHGAYGEARRGEEKYGRCFLWRKCAPCGKATKHAWLRDDLSDDERATLEGEPLSAVLSPVVTQWIETLQACQVRVYLDADRRWHPGQIGKLTQWLDDNQFMLELNPEEHVVRLAGVLEAVWHELLAYKDDLGEWRSVAGILNDADYPPHRYRMFVLPDA